MPDSTDQPAAPQLANPRSATLPAIDTIAAWQNQGHLQQAEQAWLAWLRQDPNQGEVLNNLANLYKTIGRTDAAETLYRHAIRVRPSHVEALNNLGNLLKGQGQLAEAEHCLRQALLYAPEHPDIRNNLAVLLHERGDLPEAEQHFRQILAAHPQHIEALNNLGNLLKDRRQAADAEACYRQVLARQATHAEARWNLGLLLLLRGDLTQGWPLYEARHDPARQNREVKPPPLATSVWRGEPLHGQHLLVWPEQGHGDEIQFVRYLPLLKQGFGARRITLICKPPLLPLLQQADAADAVLPLGAQPPEHDRWVLIGSLPGLCHAAGLPIPATLPYLRAAPQRVQCWQRRLHEQLGAAAASEPRSIPATQPRLRVGLTWAGSPLHRNDRHRSLPSPALLAPLWQVPGIDFISLQIGGQHSAPPGPLLDLTPQIRDFADSAALLAGIDVLITVDSALAHLAGAMGRACWVLLPWQGLDWRWGEQSEHSAWYPGALRLFRQQQGQTWADVINTVADELNRWQAQQQASHQQLAKLPAADLQRVRAWVDALLTAQRLTPAATH